MTGPEHYRIAQDLVLAQTAPHTSGVRILREHVDSDVIAVAQVHATLALAAAAVTAPADLDRWYEVTLS